jgi:hypothetical protein
MWVSPASNDMQRGCNRSPACIRNPRGSGCTVLQPTFLRLCATCFVPTTRTVAVGRAAMPFCVTLGRPTLRMSRLPSPSPDAWFDHPFPQTCSHAVRLDYLDTLGHFQPTNEPNEPNSVRAILRILALASGTTHRCPTVLSLHYAILRSYRRAPINLLPVCCHAPSVSAGSLVVGCGMSPGSPKTDYMHAANPAQQGCRDYLVAGRRLPGAIPVAEKVKTCPSAAAE